MKLSRRGIMGAILGGAVAGPEGAKEMWNTAKTGRTTYGQKVSNTPPSTDQQVDNYLGRMESQKKKYQSIIDGTYDYSDDYMVNIIDKAALMRDNIEALKSVSGAGKNYIHNKGIIERHKKDMLQNALIQLPETLKAIMRGSWLS